MSNSSTFTIRVPASAANIGPGFDCLGLALSMHLTVQVTLLSSFVPSTSSSSSSITITYKDSKASTVSLDPSINMITKTASYIACLHSTSLPSLALHIVNPIPLGRGMGSSGAAVVAGCILANEVCNLNLDRNRLMDFALVVEGHPDNVAASMFGGFTAGYMKGEVEDLSDVDGDNKNDHGNSSDNNTGTGTSSMSNGTDSHDRKIPGQNLGVYIPIPWPKSIKAVIVIPTFELATKLARSVLPPTYTRAEVVFNLQRLAVLTTSLSQYTAKSDTRIIYEAMKDKIHQPYRSHLVPGLTQILDELTPESCPGLLGICMSGAGPCVLAITNKNHEQVGERIKAIWTSTKAPDGENGIESEVVVLDVETDGAVVLRS